MTTTTQGLIGTLSGLLLLFGVGAAKRQQMKSIDFKQLGGAGVAAQTLRLCRGPSGPVFFLSHTESTPPIGADTTISALSPSSSNRQWDVVATIKQIVPAQPRWDAAVSSNRKLQIVYEKVGGAINSLILRTTAGESKPLTGSHGLQSFSLPRFAKPSGHEPFWVTAVMDNRTCVALSLSNEADLHTLDQCSDGLLVSTGTGFVFLHKTTVPGVVRGNDIRPGRLYATAVDDQFRPTGPPTEVVRSIVFEFDADLSGNKLVVAATTPAGVSIASSDLPKVRFAEEEYSAPTTLLSPGILEDSEQKVTIGALDSNGGDRARVLMAQIAVP